MQVNIFAELSILGDCDQLNLQVFIKLLQHYCDRNKLQFKKTWWFTIAHIFIKVFQNFQIVTDTDEAEAKKPTRLAIGKHWCYTKLFRISCKYSFNQFIK